MTIKQISDHIGSRPDKFYKTTLFHSSALLLGLNCLEPGQVQHPHDHVDQDKFYYVVTGEGEFWLGEDRVTVDVGNVVWASAGVVHGVENRGSEPLVLLMGIAPAPA
jgi:quercetin dioxygenase-like cupin family protein